jgi:predicted esterase
LAVASAFLNVGCLPSTNLMLNINPNQLAGFILKRGTIISCFILVASFHSLSAQQVIKTSTAGTKMWIYTPPSYSSGTGKHPLLIFLHGGGEIGDDIYKLTTKTSHLLPPKLISVNQWDTSRPFIVVSPQLKRDWSIPNVNDQIWPVAYIDEVVEFVKKNYRVDTYKIYFTGISSGGAACWDYAAAYPAKVAALNPISGKSDKTKACLIKDTPVWAFHGENDALVPNKFSIDMVNAIKACNGTFKPRLNLLAAKSHEGWNELYSGQSGYNIYTWFLKFRKGATTNVTPYVNAGIDNKILIRSGYYTIAGDYFDWNGNISSVKWTQTLGPALILSNTTSAFLRLSALKAGIFEFQLSVTDNAGAISSDRVRLEVVNSLSGPAVTSLILMNGKTNADVKAITEGLVINKTTVGTTEFNVRANVSAGTYSVRFRVNSDQAVRTVSAVPYLIKKQTSAPEWVPTNGTCVICATPYAQTGARGAPGITLCYRITFTQSTSSSAASITMVAQPDDVITIRAIDDIIISSMPTGNQWVYNGEDIPGATGPIHKPLYPGDYFVRQISRTAYDVSNLVSFARQQQKVAAAKFEIFPNPARDYIEVKSESLPIRSSYRILRGGVTVQQGELFQDMRIELAQHLPKGDYILVINGRKKTEGAKFIIR